VASTGTLPSTRTPAPGWTARLGAGVALVLVAVAALVWPGAGPRLLLGALGAAALVRGALLVRASDVVQGGARTVGVLTAGLGAAAVVVAALSATVSGRVLVAGVPVVLLAAAGALGGADGVAQRAGRLLGAGAVVVAAVLVAVGVGAGWGPAAALATGLAALGAVLLAVPLLLGARALRADAARRPAAAPSPCAGCACGSGGGCSALPRG
jgi:hypothetical protein